ncbi:glycosyltransferase family 2 protein [Companilactobacillus sp. DQM5]|uniref:glycosyltransferase family 2 protein n=1 Tax=Companilactobacillus sp. DQM5 TaxID=3463359 RepID=UPI004059278D
MTNSDEILVSVIIPAYNVNNFIDKTIRTVLAQDYKNFELLVVDDKSTDGTGNLIDNIAKEDNRVKIFHLEKHSGVSAARNYRIDQAKGKYIFFVDGDDAIEHDFLSRMVEPMENENVDMTIASYSWGAIMSHVFTYGKGEYTELSKKKVYDSINTWGNKIGGYV